MQVEQTTSAKKNKPRSPESFSEHLPMKDLSFVSSTLFDEPLKEDELLGRKKPVKIGIIIPLAETEFGPVPPYKEIRAQAQQAESLGFSSVWLYDHLLHRFPGKDTVDFKEVWTILSALAEATQEPELGTWVLCTVFRNPALLAKMAKTFDEVSNGRLILGLGSGWHKPELDAFGYPSDHLASRFEEYLQIIVPLLHADYVDFRGTYYQANNCELRTYFHRPNEEKIPVFVGALRPRMMRLAVKYGDGWNTDWLGPESYLAQRKQELEVACQAEGRSPETLEITGGITVAFPELGKLPSWMSTPDTYISGSAEKIAEKFHMYEQLGVSHIQCNLYPNSSEALTLLGAALKAYKTS